MKIILTFILLNLSPFSSARDIFPMSLELFDSEGQSIHYANASSDIQPICNLLANFCEDFNINEYFSSMCSDVEEGSNTGVGKGFPLYKKLTDGEIKFDMIYEGTQEFYTISFFRFC